MATMTYDPKEDLWWAARLAGADVPIYNDMPMRGFYAFKPGGKKDTPKAVAFWYGVTAGDLRCKIDNQSVRYGLDIWPSAARNPIPYEVYQKVIDGGPWPSEIRIDTPSGPDSTMSTSPGLGHNSGDFETLRGNILEWADRAKRAEKKGVPTSKEEADSIADIATKLGDLLLEADKRRVEETGPLHKVWKAANEKWTAFMTPAGPHVQNLKVLGHAWIKAETKRREAAAAAANDAIAAEAKAKPDSLDSTPPAFLVPEKVTIGTRKNVSAVNRQVVVFEDGGLAKAAAYFCSLQNVDPKLYDRVKSLADGVLRAGVPVPGAKLENEEKAR